jgi:nucleotide-binding universal stress UspA family protein
MQGGESSHRPAPSPDQTTPLGPFRHLLVALNLPVDSDVAHGALWKLLRLPGTEATFCHVVMRPTTAAGNELDGAAANPEEASTVHDLRLALVAALGDRGRDVPIRILHGDPGQRICEYAEYLNSDLIVLGPRTKGTIAKALRGSVTKYVVGNSRRSVLALGD